MLAKSILAGSVFTAISSVALAQGTPPIKVTPPPAGMETGLVTVVNRLDGSVVIEPTKDSKPGAKSADDAAAKAAAEKAAVEKMAAEDATAQRFKIKSDLIENVHAGDKVKFSVTETNGAKTITKVDAD